MERRGGMKRKGDKYSIQDRKQIKDLNDQVKEKEEDTYNLITLLALQSPRVFITCIMAKKGVNDASFLDYQAVSLLFGFLS